MITSVIILQESCALLHFWQLKCSLFWMIDLYAMHVDRTCSVNESNLHDPYVAAAAIKVILQCRLFVYNLMILKHITLISTHL